MFWGHVDDVNQVNEDLAFAHYLHKVDHTQVAFSAKIITLITVLSL